jgi:translation initiation factor 3 subunit B
MPTAVSTIDDDIDYTDIEEKYVCPCLRKTISINWHRYQVHYEENFDNTLVVDGIPIIDKSKLEKLLTKIAKEFSRKGAPIKPADIFTPWDDSTGKSKGHVSSS